MRFTEGDCHILAQAIHNLTGWPMYAFNWSNRPDLHCFVKIPSGNFLDIQGISTPKEMKERWQCSRIMKFEEKYKKVWGGPVFGKHSEKRAKELAEHLVSKFMEATE